MNEQTRKALELARDTLEDLDEMEVVAEINAALSDHFVDANKMVSAPAAPVAQCRADGRCQYAIDHGAEGMGACPRGKCCMPAVPAPQPVSEPSDMEAIASVVADHLVSMYCCTRVWSAWRVGTMTEDDFVAAEETDMPHEVARAVLALRPAAPRAPLTDSVKAIIERAQRLVDNADFQLGGALSAESKASEIPSNACSKVKARHLASLRDALRAHGIGQGDA